MSTPAQETGGPTITLSHKAFENLTSSIVNQVFAQSQNQGAVGQHVRPIPQGIPTQPAITMANTTNPSVVNMDGHLNDQLEAKLLDLFTNQFEEKFFHHVSNNSKFKEVVVRIAKSVLEEEDDGPVQNSPERVFVKLEGRQGKIFKWKVSERDYNELDEKKGMPSAFIKKMLSILHPAQELKHMLLTGQPRQNKFQATKLPTRSLKIITAAMLEHNWSKKKRSKNNPNYEDDKRVYCKGVRTLITKQLEWFHKNVTSEGKRITKKKPQPSAAPQGPNPQDSSSSSNAITKSTSKGNCPPSTTSPPSTRSDDGQHLSQDSLLSLYDGSQSDIDADDQSHNDQENMPEDDDISNMTEDEANENFGLMVTAKQLQQAEREANNERDHYKPQINDVDVSPDVAAMARKKAQSPTKAPKLPKQDFLHPGKHSADDQATPGPHPKQPRHHLGQLNGTKSPPPRKDSLQDSVDNISPRGRRTINRPKKFDDAVRPAFSSAGNGKRITTSTATRGRILVNKTAATTSKKNQQSEGQQGPPQEGYCFGLHTQ